MSADDDETYAAELLQRYPDFIMTEKQSVMIARLINDVGYELFAPDWEREEEYVAPASPYLPPPKPPKARPPNWHARRDYDRLRPFREYGQWGIVQTYRSVRRILAGQLGRQRDLAELSLVITAEICRCDVEKARKLVHHAKRA